VSAEEAKDFVFIRYISWFLCEGSGLSWQKDIFFWNNYNRARSRRASIENVGQAGSFHHPGMMRQLRRV
jgi:hypothetical protein